MIEWVIEDKRHGPTPSERANYIDAVLSETTYGDYVGEDSVVQLLADLMHYCRARHIVFHQARLKAEWHCRWEERIERAHQHGRNAREAIRAGDPERAYICALDAAHCARTADAEGGGRS